MLTIDLSGRTALVLGGSRGIGGGITRLLARAGPLDARDCQATAALAALAAYLLSPWGDFVCGQSILVDGGRTIFNR